MLIFNLKMVDQVHNLVQYFVLFSLAEKCLISSKAIAHIIMRYEHSLTAVLGLISE
jgi:hypothetical protein